MEVKVINLDSRPDRWEQVQKDLFDFGITEYTRFAAFDGGFTGFNRSVYECLQGDGELLLLEDDVCFTDNINRLIHVLQFLPYDWDLLYLGANILKPQTRHKGPIYNLDSAWTSHAILYSEKGRKYCADNFNPKDGIIYDEWLRTHAQQRLKCFIMKPMIAFQRDGFSDIWGIPTSYGLKATETYLK